MITVQSPNAQRPTHDSCSKSDDVIHVVLCIYDPSGTYSQHAGVVMTSIFENTQSRVTIHILHDDTLTDDNRHKFLRTAEKYSQCVKFHDVSEHKARINHKVEEFAKTRSTIGTFYKMFIPEVLTDIDKVLYLDGDIVVNLDIMDMWSVDTGNNCLAGVHDVSHFAERVERYEVFRCWLMGCSAKTYINAGVFIMNLNMLRSRGNLFQDSMMWLDHHWHMMRWSDNDVFNGLLCKSIKLIERRFNYIHAQEEQEIEGVIIHAAGYNRTWEFTGYPYQKLYWKMYLHSAWGENSSREELIDTISLCVKKKPTELRFPLWKRIVRKIQDSDLGMIAQYIVKDIYYRIKNRFTRR